jgi:hypothetical protein
MDMKSRSTNGTRLIARECAVAFARKRIAACLQMVIAPRLFLATQTARHRRSQRPLDGKAFLAQTFL